MLKTSPGAWKATKRGWPFGDQRGCLARAQLRAGPGTQSVYSNCRPVKKEVCTCVQGTEGQGDWRSWDPLQDPRLGLPLPGCPCTSECACPCLCAGVERCVCRLSEPWDLGIICSPTHTFVHSFISQLILTTFYGIRLWPPGGNSPVLWLLAIRAEAHFLLLERHVEDTLPLCSGIRIQ